MDLYRLFSKNLSLDIGGIGFFRVYVLWSDIALKHTAVLDNEWAKA
jgi:hypothetical protein